MCVLSKPYVSRTQACISEMDCCKIDRETGGNDSIGNWMVVILESLGAWKNGAETQEQRRVAVLSLSLTSRGKTLEEVEMKKTEKCHEWISTKAREKESG